MLIGKVEPTPDDFQLIIHVVLLIDRQFHQAFGCAEGTRAASIRHGAEGDNLPDGLDAGPVLRGVKQASRAGIELGAHGRHRATGEQIGTDQTQILAGDDVDLDAGQIPSQIL